MSAAVFGSLNDNFATANLTDVVGYAEIKCRLLPYFIATERYSSGYTYHGIILIVSAVTTVLCLIFTVSAAGAARPNMTRAVFDGSGSVKNLVSNHQRVVIADETKILWVGVFQVLPVKLVVNLVNWILSATMCPLKYQLSRASLAVEVVESVSTSICIYSVISFARRVAADLRAIKTTKTRAKLISFKGIVGITLTQTPVFVGIASYGVFDRTKYVSVLDFTVGTPALMTCCEMFIISVVFLWTFTAEPYLNLMGSMPRCRSVGGAFLEVLDIRDILKGCWYMTKIILFCGRQGMEGHEEEGEGSDTYEMTKSEHAGDGTL